MIYADSSAIVKRYLDEPGSVRVREGWPAIDHVFTSRVAYAEVHAAMARKHREGEMSALDFRRMAASFDKEWLSFDHVLVDPATLREIPRLVRRYPLRGYDAIHLAAALWIRQRMDRPVDFWVSDARLASAARTERFVVINPELEQ